MDRLSFSRILLPVCTFLSLGFTSHVHANVINNIAGVDYEGLEITNSVNLSRVSVESMPIVPDSVYRYATRVEAQALLESYMPYLPTELNHREVSLAYGSQAFFDDFGITHIDSFGASYQIVSNAGMQFDYNMYMSACFYHGATGECGILNESRDAL